ncbi:MAG: putative manganese transporter [Candidatus Omnitrophota bacterium]|jgi:hypothetical protein
MDLLIDALFDTLKLLPLLAAVYFFVSFIEFRFGERMGDFLTRFNKFGPVIGALFGCIPQCGFSVVASALYVKKVVSVGTLIAVFISTSDEAVPILLSIPDKIHLVGTLILIKVAIAITAGVVIDLILRPKQAVKLKGRVSTRAIYEEAITGHSGCCSHEVDEKRSKIKSLLIHPLWHTIKIFGFLLLLSVMLNCILDRIGEERIGSMLLNGTMLQPVLAAAIGLIPNCFTSVFLAGMFVKGAISFGSMVAGLCSGAGLGMLVLVKENKNIKDTFFIIGLLLGISVLAGVVIQLAGRV